MSYQLTTMVLGIGIASAILYMVRRDRLHGPYAYWWLGVTLAAIVLGLKPTLVDEVANLTGVTYPPTLLFSLVIGLILLRMLRMDIESSRHERRIRRLAQQLAIVAEQNDRLQDRLDKLDGEEAATHRRTGTE